MSQNQIPTKSSLSPARRRLLETFQKLNFGRLENLSVSGGEPDFSHPPRLVRDIKIGAQNGPRPEASSPDFLLRNEFIEFFQHLEQLGNGTVECVEVRHGLPLKMEVQIQPS